MSSVVWCCVVDEKMYAESMCVLMLRVSEEGEEVLQCLGMLCASFLCCSCSAHSEEKEDDNLRGWVYDFCMFVISTWKDACSV